MSSQNFLRMRFEWIWWLLWPVMALAQPINDTDEPNTDSLYLIQTRTANQTVSFSFAVGAGFENNQIAFTNNKLLIDFLAGIRYGWFVENGAQFGVSYQAIGSSFIFGSQNELKIFNQTAGIFGRLYARPGFFGDVSYGLGGGFSERIGSVRHREKFWSQQATVGLGLGLFWFRQVNFEITLRYHRYWAFPEFSSGFDMGGLSLQAGISWVLMKKSSRKH